MRPWVAGLGACVLFALLAARATLGAPDNATNRARLDNTVRYLQDAQNTDGGFGGNVGEASSPEFTPWVALALAAAGINPQDQSRSGGTSAYTYLVEHAGGLRATTDFERELLVVDAAGTSPQDFGGVDLVEEILNRRLPEGGFFHEQGKQTPAVNDTIFAILALSPIHEPAVQEAVKSAVEWLEREQNSDGSWPSTCPRTVAGCSAGGSDPEANVGMTGAAIEALNAAGSHDTEAQQNALGYLHRVQEPDGGFAESPAQSAESETSSTAWAVQGMWAAGENPETWKQSTGREPLDYLESMQHEDGSVQWKASSDANPVWMTAYAAPAYAGQPYPAPVVPREEPHSNPTSGSGTPSSPPAGTGESGGGGESTQPGGGVIAGGGSYGAALFSRPQPQSKGSTPGGVRQLRPARVHTARRGATRQRAAERDRNPGPARTAPVPTTASAVTEPNGAETGAGAGSAARGQGSASSGAGSSTATGSARDDSGAGSASAGAGTGGGSPAGGVPLAGESGVAQAGGREVKGLLVGVATSVDTHDVLEPGAQGLHGAGAGASQSGALAIGIGGAALLLALAGSLLERRRPRAIL